MVDRRGDAGVGAGHHRGDGEHGWGEEVDVAHPGREAGAVGDAAEHLAEQHQHGHGHGQGEHEQLRDAGARTQVAVNEDGELVQGDGPLAEGAGKGVHVGAPAVARWKKTSSRLGDDTSRSVSSMLLAATAPTSWAAAAASGSTKDTPTRP